MIALPTDGDLKLNLAPVFMIVILAGYIVIGWRSYRYANNLISTPAMR